MKKYILSFAVMSLMAITHAEVVHHDASKPTISQRGYAMECWQDTETGYYYSDAECKTRKSPAEIFSYVKLSKDPYVGGLGFKCCDPSRLDDPEYDWAVETKYLLKETDTRFAEFEVYGADVKNARLKWYKDNWNYVPENNVLVSVYVNGELVYSYDKDDKSEPLFWRYAVPLPDLKTGDRVRFEVAKPGTEDDYFYRNTVFTACLEYERSGLAYVPLTIKVLSREKLEGEKEPELEWCIMEGSTVSGYDLGDIILKRDEGETPGKYTIHASRGENTDPVYDITFREGTFVILSKEEAEFIEVATLDELRSAVNAYEFPRIKLVADINLNGMENTLCGTFHGTIEGDGHAVVGSTGGRVKCASLFDNADGALIQNINFKDIRIDSDEIGNLGVIASEVTDCTFKNVTMDHVSVWTNESNAGTLAGKSNGCHFEQVQVNGCDVTVDCDQAGGLVGYSTRDHFIYCSTDEHSSVFADGYDDIHRARCGGLVGAGKQGEYIHCVNRAIVGGDLAQLGGIIGFADGSKLSLCINIGMVVSMDESDFGPLSERYRRSELPRDMYRYGDEIYRPQYLTDDDRKNVDSDGAIGGIVGHGENTQVTECVNFGPFYGTSTDFFTHDGVAGIVGHAEKSHVELCANYGYNAKEGSKYMGGIVGDATTTIINNCFNATASAYGSISTNGSIVGMAWQKTKVNNCLSAVAQRIVGEDWALQGALVDVFVDPATGNNYRLEADNETNEWEMMVNSNLMGSGLLAFWLNNGQENREQGVAPWRQNLNADGNKTMDVSPVLDATHNEVTTADITTVTHITDAEGLMAFAQRVNNGEQLACAVLDNDIVMPAGKTWTPIGKDEPNKHYRGLFDGQGHSISGLVVTINENEQGAGLFGTIQYNAIIRNVIVDNTCVITNKGIGGAAGIVGRFNTNANWGDAIIDNCASYASVNARKHAGGIFGRVLTGKDAGPNIRVYVESCYNMGTITADDGDSALLCGYTKDNGYVSNCWSGGLLKMSDPNYQYWPFSTVNDNNNRKIECLVGYNRDHHVENCYIIDPDVNVDHYNYRTDYDLSLQDGVEIVSDASVSSGELCYKLNKGVVDGTQRWYQTVTGEHTDACPVLTKLEDGTNMVFRYTADDAFGYGNTSCEEIRTVILGIESLSEHPITDIDASGDTSVGDLLKFINAARKK